MSIPYRPKKASDDVGPCYYSPSQAQNTKYSISTSKIGSSSLNSTVERFPLRHSCWGYPEPGHYNYADSLKAMSSTSIAKDANKYSSAFLTTSRDNYFYNENFSITPGPGTYDVEIRKNQELQKKLAYEKLKGKSEVEELLYNAAKAQKSLARYEIENDVNFVQPKPKIKEETLPRRPLQAREIKQEPFVDKKLHEYLENEQLKKKYDIQTEEINVLLADEIEKEIDETARHYREVNGEPEVQQIIPNNVLKELKEEELKELPFESEGIAFNTRQTSQMVDEVKELEKEINEMMGPGRYDSYKSSTNRGSAISYSKEAGREVDIINDGERELVKIGNNISPAVGTYDVKDINGKAKSFLLNEDRKWV